MLTLQSIKADPEYIIARLAVKGCDARAQIEEILHIDAERRRLQTICDTDASKLKKLSSQIAILMKEGKRDEAEAAKAEVTEIKSVAKELQAQLEDAENRQREILLSLPNTPCEAVPELSLIHI